MKTPIQILRTNEKSMFHKYLSVVVIILITACHSFAQVAINETGADASTEVELDIQSTTKGVLLPLLTEAQRDAVPGPVAGLIIFNRSGGYHNFYDGTNWQQINRSVALSPSINPAGVGNDSGIGIGVSVTDVDHSAILHVNTTDKGFLLPRSSIAPAETAGMIYYSIAANDLLFHDGTQWFSPFTTQQTAGAVGASTPEGMLIGLGTIEASAKMEVQTTTDRGMFFPRMTSGNRDLIPDPEEGLLIYNSDDNEFQYFAASTWYKWVTGIPPLGSVASNPGQSCKDVYDNNPASVGVDALYYIDPDGVGGDPVIQGYCDMNRNGGGWTLVFNSGLKKTNMENTAQFGSLPIIIGAAGDAAAKFSDANIDLIRGDLANSIIWAEAQFGSGTEVDIYFRENLAYNANCTVNGCRIDIFNANYANAAANIGMTQETSNHDGALCSWNQGGGTGSMILSYGAEEWIWNAGTHTCSGTDLDNRSVCNGLLWVKKL
jgi:hypothetical protein